MRVGRSSWRLIALPLASLVLINADVPDAPTITPLRRGQEPGRWLTLHHGGRQVAEPAGGHVRFRRQWPGSYFEGRFRGSKVDLSIGTGDVSLRVSVDGSPPAALVRPKPGLYRISAGRAGPHSIRVDVVSESQAAATTFNGILAPHGSQPLAPATARARQMEFIGDSHTVGYGNTATTQDCSVDDVWRTTDTSQGPAGVLARRYDADYRVNAISGRGVVRNYDGFDAPTLPRAYPFALLDGTTPDVERGWHPDVVVIGLGTNDFSTPLKASERWADRDALHTDYARTYVAFVDVIRRRHPRAFIVIWATDIAGGEVAAQAQRVVARLKDAGERRVAFVEVKHLRFGGCHAHPDRVDDRTIADAIGHAIDAQGDIWMDAGKRR